MAADYDAWRSDATRVAVGITGAVLDAHTRAARGEVAGYQTAFNAVRAGRGGTFAPTDADTAAAEIFTQADRSTRAAWGFYLAIDSDDETLLIQRSHAWRRVLLAFQGLSRAYAVTGLPAPAPGATAGGPHWRRARDVDARVSNALVATRRFRDQAVTSRTVAGGHVAYLRRVGARTQRAVRQAADPGRSTAERLARCQEVAAGASAAETELARLDAAQRDCRLAADAATMEALYAIGGAADAAADDAEAAAVAAEALDVGVMVRIRRRAVQAAAIAQALRAREDAFADAYDGGYASCQYAAAQGRALAARLRAE